MSEGITNPEVEPRGSEAEKLVPRYQEIFDQWLRDDLEVAAETLAEEERRGRATPRESEAALDKFYKKRKKKLKQILLRLQDGNPTNPLSAAEEAFGAGEISGASFREVKRFEDLKKIAAILQEAKKTGIEKLVIHGKEYRDEHGEIHTVPGPDLDARSGLYLFELAGIKAKFVESVPKGETVPGAIHIDTGPYEYPTLTEDGSIFFSDHGEKQPKRHSSAAKQIYETLVKAGLLKKEKWLDNYVKFVTEIDNLSYPEIEDKRFFEHDWWRTLYGISKDLPVRYLAALFEEGWDPRESFQRKEAEKRVVKYTEKIVEEKTADGKVVKKVVEAPVTLWDISSKTKGMVMRSIRGTARALEEMRSAGIKNQTSELGKVVLNVVTEEEKEGKKQRIDRIPIGFPAVKAHGFDTYIKWEEGTKSFFMSSTRNLEEIYKRVKAAAPQARLIRGVMILVPPTEKNKEFEITDLLSSLGLIEGKAPVKYPEPGSAPLAPPEIPEELRRKPKKELKRDLNRIKKQLKKLQGLAIRTGPEEDAIRELENRKRQIEVILSEAYVGERSEKTLLEFARRLIEKFGAGEEPEKVKAALEKLKELEPEFEKIEEKSFEERLRKAFEIFINNLDKFDLNSVKKLKELKRENPELFEKNKDAIVEWILEKDAQKAEEKIKEVFGEEKYKELRNELMEFHDLAQALMAAYKVISEEKRRELKARVGEIGGKIKEAGDILGKIGAWMLLTLILALILALAITESGLKILEIGGRLAEKGPKADKS